MDMNSTVKYVYWVTVLLQALDVLTVGMAFWKLQTIKEFWDAMKKAVSLSELWVLLQAYQLKPTSKKQPEMV